MYVKPLALAALGFALVGCDAKSPAGAGAGASEEQASSISQNLDRLKELSTARQRGLTQSTPLLPFLVRASASLRSQSDDPALLAAECVLGLNLAERAVYLAQLESNGHKPQEVPETGHEYSLLVHGTQDQLNASCLAATLAWSAAPVVGWQSQGFADESNAKQARTLYTMGRASALIARPVLETLATKVGYTEEQLAVMAREELVKNASSLRAIAVAEMTRAQALPLSSFVLDFAGSSDPVHFIVPSEAADVSAGPFGVKVIRDGVELYGAGFVQGTRYSVETVSSALAATRTTSTATQSTDSKTAQSAKAEVKTQ